MRSTTDVRGVGTESESRGYRPSMRVGFAWPLLIATAILYGSLIPFQVDWSVLRSAAGGFSFPQFQGTTLEDAITNVLVYVPLGAALILWLGRASLMALAATVGAAGVMSFAVETLQGVMRLRVASLSDVMLNVCGALLGAILAIGLKRPLVRVLRGIRSEVSTSLVARLASVLTVGLLVYSLLPFSFVTDARALYASFGRARWNMDTANLASIAHWPLRSMLDHSVQAIWFAVLGFLLTLSCRERGSSTMTAFAHAVKHGGILVCLIEFMQLFTPLHCFDTSVIVLRCVAVTFGAWIAAFTVESATLTNLGRRSTRVVSTSVFVMLGLVQLLAIFLPELQRLAGPHSGVSPAATLWMPFYALWRLPMDRAVVEVLALVATYATLTATGILMLSRRYGSKAVPGAVVATVATAIAVEVLTHYSGRAADITSPVLALAAAISATKLLNFVKTEPAAILSPPPGIGVLAPVFTRHN